MISKKLLLLCLLALLPNVIFAQEDSEAPSEQDSGANDVAETADYAEAVDSVLTSSPNVQTAILFPNNTEFKFIVADPEPVSVLIGFHNLGDTTFNITGIQAWLMYPLDHRYFIQNFTRFVYGGIAVEGGEQQTLLYKFLPDPGLDARDFDLTVGIFYHDENGGNFSTVVFNGTISLVDRPDSVDAQTFFKYVGAIGLVGLISFVVYRNFLSAPAKKRGRSTYETGTKASSSSEWLEGTAATVGKRAASPRKSTRAKTN